MKDESEKSSLEKLREYAKEVSKEEMKIAPPGSLPRSQETIMIEVLAEELGQLDERISKLEKVAK